MLAGVFQETLILRCVLWSKAFQSHRFSSQILLSNCYTCSFALPGHAKLLQLFVLLLGPTQSAPPLFGEGFVQVRVRIREPTPQVLEQLLQDDH